MDAYLKFLRERLGHALIVAPAAGVVARNASGQILLQRRVDDGSWGLPGGWVSPGESVAEAAVREAREETGWVVRVTGLLGVYSNPGRHTHTYPNGDQAQFVAVVFNAKAVEHASSGDGEASEWRFFSPEALPSPLFLPDVDILQDAASGKPGPFWR